MKTVRSTGCETKSGPRWAAKLHWIRDQRADGLFLACGNHEGSGSRWEAYGKEHAMEIRECAEVSFVPREKYEHKDTQPLRYLAIRIRPGQETLFDDGGKVRHFAVLTNTGERKAMASGEGRDHRKVCITY